MSTITLEEHFVTESFLRAIGAHDRETHPQFAEVQSKLLDIGTGRIADMDKAGIDLQVLSLAAMGFDALDADTASSLARDINDELAEGAFPSQTFWRFCDSCHEDTRHGSHRAGALCDTPWISRRSPEWHRR